MKRLIVALIGVSALLVACHPNEATDYSQWTYPATVKNISTICPAAHPQTYPGHDPSKALAVDFMVPDEGKSVLGFDCGRAMSDWAVNLARLGTWHVEYVAWRQHIWDVRRAAEGWRLMPDRGSWTANHMDHVHVSMWTQTTLTAVSVSAPIIPSVGIPAILIKIRQCESSGSYTAQNPSSTASGAYQFLDSTWRGMAQFIPAVANYSRAMFAPPALQDQAAVKLFNLEGTAPWAASRGCWG